MWTSQNVTDSIIAQYEHPRYQIVIDDMALDPVTEDDIGSGSISIKGGTSDSSRFDVGGCVIGSCSFVLLDYAGVYRNYSLLSSYFDVYVGYGENPTWEKLGRYYVATSTRRRNSISITGYDALRKADKVKFDYSPEFDPVTSDIITEACRQAGITLGTLPSISMVVDKSAFSNTSYTCRQAIQYCLQMTGSFAFVDRNERLICKWYDMQNPVKEFDDAFGSDISEAFVYTGVKVGDAFVGTSGYVYSMDGNPFIKNEQGIAESLYSKLSGMGIREVNISVLADPRIEPGDVITVPFFNGDRVNKITIPVTALTLKGSLKETFSCSAASADTLDDQRASETQKVEEAATEQNVKDALQEAKDYTDSKIEGDYIKSVGGTGDETTLNEPTINKEISIQEGGGSLDISAVSHPVWGYNNVAGAREHVVVITGTIYPGALYIPLPGWVTRTDQIVTVDTLAHFPETTFGGVVYKEFMSRPIPEPPSSNWISKHRIELSGYGVFYRGGIFSGSTGLTTQAQDYIVNLAKPFAANRFIPSSPDSATSAGFIQSPDYVNYTLILRTDNMTS